MTSFMPRRSWTPLLILFVIALIFGQCTQFEFVLWDDNIHVYENLFFYPLEFKRLVYFWRHDYLGLYVPLSYMAFAGLAAIAQRQDTATSPPSPAVFDAHVFHTANVIIHGLNSLLVFFILRRLTKREVPALLGALLFAVHPLQVETVAWVAELRGLSSAFFAFGAILLFLRGADEAGKAAIRFGLGTCLLYGMALLCKPSVLPLPFILFLLARGVLKKPSVWSAVRTLPLLLVAVPDVVITRALQPGRSELIVIGWSHRLQVAGDAVAFYLGKFLWPASLGIDYGRKPDVVLTHTWGHWTWLAPLMIALVLWLSRKRVPALAFGALISLAAISPVLGLVPFDFQRYSTVADRYVYFAMLGPALMMASALPDRRPTTLIGGILLTAYALMSNHQAGTWRNSETLFRHALAVNPISISGNGNIAQIEAHRGNYHTAIRLLTVAMNQEPNSFEERWHLAENYTRLKDYHQAELMYRSVLRLAPGHALIHAGFASLLTQMGRDTEAIPEYQDAIRLIPKYVIAKDGLGRTFVRVRRWKDAETQFHAAITDNPTYIPAYMHLAYALDLQGKFDEEANVLQEAVRRSPNFLPARQALEMVQQKRSQSPQPNAFF